MGSNANQDEYRIRVLLVDDESDASDLAGLCLRDSDPGLSIDTESSPVRALQLLQERQYDCVVSDYQMPEMNGIQFTIEIRRLSNIPIIIYTGRGSEEVASAAFSAGADDYVRKERELSHYQVLAKRIRHAVERNRMKMALTNNRSHSLSLPTLRVNINPLKTILNPKIRLPIMAIIFIVIILASSLYLNSTRGYPGKTESIKIGMNPNEVGTLIFVADSRQFFSSNGLMSLSNPTAQVWPQSTA